MKTIKRIFALCLVAASLVFLGGFASDNAADVIKDAGCSISSPWGGGFTTESVQVANNGGNVMLTCHFEGLLNDSGKAWHDSGFLCGTFMGSTENSWKVITPSGQGTLKCMIKKPKL